MSSLKTAVLAILSAWRWTGRFRQPACRFYPSCSQYMKTAVERHGVCKGLLLGAVRLCKCHPFHDGGVDEVPPVLTAGAMAAMPCLDRAARRPAPAFNAQNVMKSGLKDVFAGSDGRMVAQAFCLNKLPAGIALSTIKAKISKSSQDRPSNTSRSA